MSTPNAFERRMRRKAHTMGLTICKSRARNPRDVTYGGWMIADPEGVLIAGGESPGYTLSLDEVGEWLDDLQSGQSVTTDRNAATVATAKIKSEVWNLAYGAALGVVVIETGRTAYRVYDTSGQEFIARRGATVFPEDDLPGVLAGVWRSREDAGLSVDPVKAADDLVAHVVSDSGIELEFATGQV